MTTEADRRAAVQILDSDGIDPAAFEHWQVAGEVADEWEDDLQPYEHAASVVSKARAEGYAECERGGHTSGRNERLPTAATAGDRSMSSVIRRLEAENEELRREVHRLKGDVHGAGIAGELAGAEKERAAVVAWLRTSGDGSWFHAREIEAGEHRKGGGA